MSDRPEPEPVPEIPSQPLSMTDALATLSQGVIQDDHGVLPWGSNYAYLVTVADERRALLAVYKPQRGERSLWDFPDGTLCYREVAAYVVSEALDWAIVPPTVLRGGPYGLGSLQFFVDHDPEINYFTPLPPECGEQLQRMAVFDYLINNADRKGGHCLLDSQGHLWGIDHGVSFHYQLKLRTVIWDYAGQPLPEPIVDSLKALDTVLSDPATLLRQTLGGLLSAREVDALLARLHHLLQTRRFVLPGRGPNYPWPPV
ncbi:MAG: SCO1664 family protein [Anaerolineae bacterium]|nr:SCO1664 family protein [Anaerolineae bacterium]